VSGFDALPAGWERWSDAEERVVLVYRPDVFDADGFPAPCLPTLYLTHGRRNRRPGGRTPTAGEAWYVRLFLEPEVGTDPEAFETRERAVAGAVDLAERFADGTIDYRGLYQVPRPAYLDRLDELTGREP
jgi:hypothetical protein